MLLQGQTPMQLSAHACTEYIRLHTLHEPAREWATNMVVAMVLSVSDSPPARQ